MRFAWALLVLLACHAEDDDAPPICPACRVAITAHTGLATGQIAHNSIALCLNGASCTDAVFDSTCKYGTCNLVGAFDAKVSISVGVLSFSTATPISRSDTDIWSVEVRDAQGETLYSATGSAPYLPQQTCDSDCATLELELN
ncbi:MAG: hypothetical protein ABI678_24655 [Kofleriaceae bacterium]